MYNLSDYSFDLPEELISHMPEEKRDTSRLLCLEKNSGEVSHKSFIDIANLLKPSDVLVVNNTKVIPAKLTGRKESGGKIEALLLDYTGGLKNRDKNGCFECQCLVKASRRPKLGSKLIFHDSLSAEVTGFNDGMHTLRFNSEGDFEQVIDQVGKIPLPPYIKREEDSEKFNDRQNYQTVYAKNKGAVAAPTAGLHFTGDLLEDLKKTGIRIAPITLHVGYGTFSPVRVSDVREHKIHTERFVIPEESAKIINTAKKEGRRIVAVGTTSVRTLEYSADENGNIRSGAGECDLFIYPGYRFKTVDAIITNFHIPESTLLMLISAFAGRENILNAYEKAIEERYRFFSYGDAMFIA